MTAHGSAQRVTSLGNEPCLDLGGVRRVKRQRAALVRRPQGRLQAHPG